MAHVPATVMHIEFFERWLHFDEYIWFNIIVFITIFMQFRSAPYIKRSSLHTLRLKHQTQPGFTIRVIYTGFTYRDTTYSSSYSVITFIRMTPQRFHCRIHHQLLAHMYTVCVGLNHSYFNGTLVRVQAIT